MAGGYGTGGHGSLASRAGAARPADPPSPARHCFVNGQPSLLVEWRRGRTGWEGRVITVCWVDAVGWATVERWLPASDVAAEQPAVRGGPPAARHGGKAAGGRELSGFG